MIINKENTGVVATLLFNFLLNNFQKNFSYISETTTSKLVKWTKKS